MVGGGADNFYNLYPVSSGDELPAPFVVDRFVVPDSLLLLLG